MFGYVRIRKPELLVKDYECYKGFTAACVIHCGIPMGCGGRLR